VSEPNNPRPGTKQALLTDMLRAQSGATIRELAAATGWQANTVHSALATLRRLGRNITVERSEAGNHYRLDA
jgi:DNA-binding IclR family transcriptional regulator